MDELWQKRLRRVERAEDKDDIQKFCIYARGTRHVSVKREKKYLHSIKTATWLMHKPLRKATKDDIEELQYNLETGSYSQYTRKDVLTILRVFYIWYDNDDPKYPQSERVKAIRPREPKLKFIYEEDLLNRPEILALEEATHDIRKKTPMETCYQAAARPGELYAMRVRDYRFDDDGTLWFHLPGTKTDLADRNLPIGDEYAIDLFRKYRQTYTTTDQDAPLWTNTFGQPLSNYAFSKICADAKAAAGIKKQVTPKTFRKCKATHLKSANWGTPLIKEYLGHSQRSHVLDAYVARSENSLKTAVLKLYDKRPDQKKRKVQELVLNELLKDKETMRLTYRALMGAVEKLNSRGQLTEDDLDWIVDRSDEDAQPNDAVQAGRTGAFPSSLGCSERVMEQTRKCSTLEPISSKKKRGRPRKAVQGVKTTILRHDGEGAGKC